ncbi:hypothetical protein KVT40_000554 [Elsinoe batatas]|uniref:Major facilitator superfamily (MFS) profile domain-containing protein n=1 Tax=Elsinoe batatas TaxID=2601811 RepID=A0A8K0L7Y9_9PEZI|nr:hypothetical protein KVT40_000554 [Elsinoe batatas]
MAPLLRLSGRDEDNLVAFPSLKTQTVELSSCGDNGIIIASNIVDFDGPDDPARPTNWSSLRRWSIVVWTSLVSLVVSFASSVWSAAIPLVSTEFDASQDVVLLGVSFYVLGFALGPQVFGPASELYGRTRPFWTGLLIFCILQIPLALSRDVVSALILRFLSGLTGSAAPSIISGIHVDILNPADMGISMAIYIASAFCGPVLGPILGNIIVTSTGGWRWNVWIILISGAVSTAITMYITPETSSAVILRRKAQKLRLETGNYALHARIFTAYMSLSYGILYLTFVMYPFAFVSVRGWDPIPGSLPFLGLFIGICIACIIIAMHSLLYVRPRLLSRGRLQPEDRLPPMIFGSVCLTGGLFWFAWTSSPDIHWLNQVASGIPLGCGIILVFMCAIAYLVAISPPTSAQARLRSPPDLSRAWYRGD